MAAGTCRVIRPVDLISPAYKQTQVTLHAQPRGYGQKGSKWAATVQWLIGHFRATSVLDYGCGQGTLATTLRQAQLPGVRIAEYDPAITGKDGLPEFADLVVCTDVLEHVEPDRLDTVLRHLQTLARRAILLVVNLEAANKVLSDGRNAHLIQQPATWWQQRIAGAGMTEVPLPDMPTASAYLQPEKRIKAWVAVVTP